MPVLFVTRKSYNTLSRRSRELTPEQICGDKQGMSQTLFYKTLIRKADTRFSAWLKEKHNGH